MGIFATDHPLFCELKNRLARVCFLTHAVSLSRVSTLNIFEGDTNTEFKLL